MTTSIHIKNEYLEWAIKEHYAHLIEELNYEIKMSAASNPLTPPDVLDKLLDEDTIWLILDNPNTSIKTLEKLSTHKNYSVRVCVANHENVADEIKKSILEDYKSMPWYKQLTLAKDENASPIILDELSTSVDFQVRYHVARNNNTLSITLEKMSKDSNDSIRAAVASNINTEKKVLDELATDSHYFVQSTARKNKNY